MTTIKTIALQDTAKDQIVMLDKYLKKIYTVEIESKFTESGKMEVDLLDEIVSVKGLVYVLENSLQIKEGSVYEEYSKYLSNAKKRLDELTTLEADINSKYGADISNINALISGFNEILKDN